ncbi:MAG: hypothetical protein ACRDRJ_26950 [Streptosporangiaceae bacterium]
MDTGSSPITTLGVQICAFCASRPAGDTGRHPAFDHRGRATRSMRSSGSAAGQTRGRLRTVAYWTLGSLAEADDAVQET